MILDLTVFLSCRCLAMREVKMGADSDDFADMVILNFVTNAARAGCSASEIRSFVRFLRQ